MIRLGEATPEQAESVRQQLSGSFPSGDNDVRSRAGADPRASADAWDHVTRGPRDEECAPSQESQIHYALTLRSVETGWDEPTSRDYFGWFNEVQSARGGMSFGGFIRNIKNEAVKHVPSEIKAALADVIAGPATSEAVEESRAFVKKWTVADLLETVSRTDRTPDFGNGKSVFSAAQCYKCHRMGLQGGILGPNLTGAGGRFNHKDLLTAILEPNQTISDQYAATQFLTTEGKVIVGRIVNMNGGRLQVMTNMLDPSSLVQLDRNDVEETMPSKNSLMPAGLLDTFEDTDIADLIAYLRAGGSPSRSIDAGQSSGD